MGGDNERPRSGMSTLLEDFTSSDPHRIWSASCAVAKLRDSTELDRLALHLAEIQRKTKGIQLGGMFVPNAEHLRFALHKLTYHRDRRGCLCRLYPERLFFNPQEEAAAGNVRIEGTTYVEGKWVDFYTCVCALCGARYRVEERESHYTWWGWKALAG